MRCINLTERYRIIIYEVTVSLVNPLRNNFKTYENQEKSLQDGQETIYLYKHQQLSYLQGAGHLTEQPTREDMQDSHQ